MGCCWRWVSLSTLLILKLVFFLIHQIMCSVIFVVCFSSIYQRSNQQLVLTVTTPPLANDPFTLDYSPEQGFEGAAVIVAHRKGCANGNASQLWRYDPITGFIEAFSADTTNRGTVNLIWSNGQQLYLNEANCITTLESRRKRDGRYQLVDSFNFGEVSRQGINSSPPRANFPWKIVKENMRNNRFHAKYEKKVLFFSCQNLSTETRGRGKENLETFVRKADFTLIYHFISGPNKKIRFPNTATYSLVWKLGLSAWKYASLYNFRLSYCCVVREYDMTNWGSFGLFEHLNDYCPSLKFDSTTR